MSSFSIKGIIERIEETQTFDSGFAKREFAITTESEYQQTIKFEIVKGKNADKDKTKVLNDYQVNEPVEVWFDIRGNEYNGKVYNNLVCWKLERQEGASTPKQNDAVSEAEIDADPADDDLPF